MKKRISAAILAVLFVTLCVSPVYTLGMQTDEQSGTLTAGYEKKLEKVQYGTEYQYSEEVTEGVSALISAGSNGLVEKVDYVVRKNGIPVTSREIAVMTIKEPVKQVILMGTAKQAAYAAGNDQESAGHTSCVTYEGPVQEGTGSFITPLAGYKLGSPYGMRNGRMHFGVDLLAPSGTDILAADTGTVVFTGYRNSYGLLVVVDHGNGFSTYYAHCSAVSVNVGDNVQKGMKIADVGRTGNATGTHVHFEIRSNDICMNPASYISISGKAASVSNETEVPIPAAVTQAAVTPEALSQTQLLQPENPQEPITPEAISQETPSVTTEALDNAE